VKKERCFFFAVSVDFYTDWPSR